MARGAMKIEPTEHGIRVLLVDDEAEFRDATATALKRRGFDVSEAESGNRALEMLEAGHEPDVMVLDLRMEGLDGLSTLEELRKRASRLPVIILTGYGQTTDAMAGIGLEIVDFLQKPVDMERLALCIRDASTQSAAPLRERRLDELIVPVTSYKRVYDDEPLKVWVHALRDAMFQEVMGDVSERGHRSILVFDRSESFVGMLRWTDVLKAMIPEYLRDNASLGAFTGMFLAQSKVLGQAMVNELVDDRPPLDVRIPLIEAVNIMIQRGVINLPVARNGALVGIIRDRDLMLEVARFMLG